jgi:hypothetical protein
MQYGMSIKAPEGNQYWPRYDAVMGRINMR